MNDSDVQGGPPLLVPALAFAGLTVAGAVVGASGPRPGSTPTEVLEYLLADPGPAAIGAALLFGSAFPLVVFAATAVARYGRLGVRVPGPSMGMAGALLAAAALSASALFGWAAVQVAPLGEPAMARLLVTLWFGFGGVGFAAPMGLLVLGLAVPALVLGLLPRWLAWAGVVVGVLALLSTAGLVLPALYPLIPVGRFGGVLFLLGVALLLPRTRAAAVAA